MNTRPPSRVYLLYALFAAHALGFATLAVMGWPREERLVADYLPEPNLFALLAKGFFASQLVLLSAWIVFGRGPAWLRTTLGAAIGLLLLTQLTIVFLPNGFTLNWYQMGANHLASVAALLLLCVILRWTPWLRLRLQFPDPSGGRASLVRALLTATFVWASAILACRYLLQPITENPLGLFQPVASLRAAAIQAPAWTLLLVVTLSGDQQRALRWLGGLLLILAVVGDFVSGGAFGQLLTRWTGPAAPAGVGVVFAHLLVLRFAGVRLAHSADDAAVSETDADELTPSWRLHRWPLPSASMVSVAVVLVFGLVLLPTGIGTAVTLRWSSFDLFYNASGELEQITLTHPTVDRIEWLQRRPSLKQLTVWLGIDLTEEEVAALGGVTQVERFALPACDLNDQQLRYFAKMTRVTELDLSHNRVSGPGLNHLRGLPLRSLDCSGNPLVDLRPINRFAALDELLLTHTPVNDALLRQLELPKLRRLWLTSRAVTDDGAEHLGGFQELRDLYISNTSIGNRGLESLGRLPRLDVLDLSYTRIEGDAIKHLTGLRHLTYLKCDSTRIDDSSAPYLLQLKTLETLDVRDTQLTPAVIRRLQRGLPDCRVDNSLGLPAGGR